MFQDEFPVTDPHEGMREVKAFAKKNYGSFKKMETAANRGDEDALSAVALYERATEAVEVMNEYPDATYGDKHLMDILKGE